MVKMKQALQRFSKPAYRLEGLSAENYSASVYCRGARVVINQSITEIIFNSNIIQNMHPMEASHLGYYYGLLNNNENQDSNSLLNKNKIKPIFSLFFNKNRYLILSLSRRGLINYKMNNSSELYTKSPLEIYEDELVISEFEPSHACYIGILAGISKGKSQTSRPTNVVKLNFMLSIAKLSIRKILVKSMKIEKLLQRGYYIFLGNGDYHQPENLTLNWTSRWGLNEWKNFIEKIAKLHANTLMIYLNGHYLPYRRSLSRINTT